MPQRAPGKRLSFFSYRLDLNAQWINGPFGGGFRETQRRNLVLRSLSIPIPYIAMCKTVLRLLRCFTTFQWWTYESLQHLSCFGFFRKYETNRVYLPRKIQTFVSSFFSNFLPFYDSVRFSKNWYPPLKLLQFSISSRCSGKMHAISLQRSTQMFIQISVVGLWPREREINESWDEEQGSNAAVGRASQLRAICVCTGEGRKRKRTGNRARNVHAGVCPRHPISYPPPCCWNSVMTVARLDWFTP